jgi:hypothetical protein
MSADAIECEGTVEHIARGDLHRVAIVAGAFGRTVLARRSGRLNQHRIKIGRATACWSRYRRSIQRAGASCGGCREYAAPSRDHGDCRR